MREGLNYIKSGFTPMSAAYLHEAVVFKDKLITSELTIDRLSRLGSYALDGSTTYTQVLSGISIFTDMLAHLHVNGNTLIAYYTNGNCYPIQTLGNSGTLYRTFSTDGITFGGSQGIPTNGRFYFDITSVSDSQLYGAIYEPANTTTQAQPAEDSQGNEVYRVSLWSIQNKGGWGTTQIYNGGIFKHSHVEANFSAVAIGNRLAGNKEKIINAQKVGDTDKLLMVGSNAMSGDGLRVIETDGFNIFADKEVLDTNSKTARRIRMGNAVGVSNVFFVPLVISEFKLSDVDISEFGNIVVTSYGLNFIQSQDFLNWSVPILLGLSAGNNIDSLRDGYYTGYLDSAQANAAVVSGGSLPNHFTIFHTAGGTVLASGVTHRSDYHRYDFNLGSSRLDISDNIINYSNQNNERITISLGNLNND